MMKMVMNSDYMPLNTFLPVSRRHPRYLFSSISMMRFPLIESVAIRMLY